MEGKNMKTYRFFTACLLGLVALGSQSCLKSYVEYFDESSAERLTTYLADLDEMLGAEQYGWRMEYFVGNEDGDFGGINVALKFDSEKGEVTAMSEEDEKEAYTSHYVLTTDSGPVLSFDTHNKILHKYGTASSEYYEGRGGDYQFFIVGYDKEKKVVNLKGKRNGKFCTLYPLSEPIESFNAKMYSNSRNFYVSTFDGFIDGQKVTGEIDVNNRQFTAYEMEVYGQDDKGQPKYDIAETKTVPYIVTEKGIHFYEPVDIFGKTFEELSFNFDMEKTDTLLTSAANNIVFKGYIPRDWLPYEFFEGDWTLTYGSGSRLDLTLIPDGERKSFRVKGFSRQFDLMFEYNIKKGRVELRAQYCKAPDTDDVVWDDDEERYYVRLCAWEEGSFFTFNTSVGMETALKTVKNTDGVIDMNASLANPTFNWVDNGGSRSIHTNSFLLYDYDTDDTSESPYAGDPERVSFVNKSYMLANLKTLVKR